MIGPRSAFRELFRVTAAMRHSFVLRLLSLGTAAMCCVAGTAVAAPSRGEVLSQQWCSQCHAVEPGQQSPNPKAPAFSAIAAEPSATEYSLHVFLQTTHATMPNFKIDPNDVDDIVGYIRSLAPKR
jgi:mono/diheme cytochrome c family protein